jgi:hypothetical protein
MTAMAAKQIFRIYFFLPLGLLGFEVIRGLGRGTSGMLARDGRSPKRQQVVRTDDIAGGHQRVGQACPTYRLRKKTEPQKVKTQKVRA